MIISSKNAKDLLDKFSSKLQGRQLEILEYNGPFYFIFPKQTKTTYLFRKFFANRELLPKMIDAYCGGISTFSNNPYGPEYFHFCRLVTCMALADEKIKMKDSFEHYSLVFNKQINFFPVAGGSRKEIIHALAEEKNEILRAFIIKPKKLKIKDKRIKKNLKKINLNNIIEQNYIIRILNENHLAPHPVLNCICSELDEQKWENKKLDSVKKIEYFIKNNVKIYSNKNLAHFPLIDSHVTNCEENAQVKIHFKTNLSNDLDVDALVLALQQLNFDNQYFTIINKL